MMTWPSVLHFANIIIYPLCFRKYWTITKLEYSPEDSSWFCPGFGLLAPWLLPKNCASWHKIQQYPSWRKHGASCLWFRSCKAFGWWRRPCYNSGCRHIRLFGTRYDFSSAYPTPEGHLLTRSLKYAKSHIICTLNLMMSKRITFIAINL